MKFYTEKGNLCGPRFDQVIPWISSSWIQFPAESIILSFVSCGVGTRDINQYHNYLREMLENALENENITSDESEHEVENSAFIRCLKRF